MPMFPSSGTGQINAVFPVSAMPRDLSGIGQPRTPVLAYPAAHFAVADGSGDHGFIYLQLRMATGRSAGIHQAVGETLSATARSHFASLLKRRKVGVTLQIDEGHEVFDAKIGNLHAVFQKA